MKVAEGAEEVRMPGERIEEVEPPEDRLHVALVAHALGDLHLGRIAEGQEVESVAEAEVVADDRREHEIGDVLEIGQHALREVEENQDVRGAGPLRARRGGGLGRHGGEGNAGGQSGSKDCFFHRIALRIPIFSTRYWNFLSWIRNARLSPTLWLSSFLPRGER
jgi:hypothetical protein